MSESVPSELTSLEDPPPIEECAGIILAAGGSSRFRDVPDEDFSGGSSRGPSNDSRSNAGGAGQPANKLLADFRGKPLITWAVDAAKEAGLADIYVVTGDTDLSSVLPDDITLIKNESWKYGQSSSLNIAITCARRDEYKKVVVGLGDAPLISPEAWTKVIETSGLIVTATYQGQRSPPVKLDEQVWISLPLGGDEGARALMQKRPDLVVEVECAGDPRDVDTIKDLEELSRPQARR